MPPALAEVQRAVSPLKRRYRAGDAGGLNCVGNHLKAAGKLIDRPYKFSWFAVTNECASMDEADSVLRVDLRAHEPPPKMLRLGEEVREIVGDRRAVPRPATAQSGRQILGQRAGLR